MNAHIHIYFRFPSTCTNSLTHQIRTHNTCTHMTLTRKYKVLGTSSDKKKSTMPHPHHTFKHTHWQPFRTMFTTCTTEQGLTLPAHFYTLSLIKREIHTHFHSRITKARVPRTFASKSKLEIVALVESKLHNLQMWTLDQRWLKLKKGKSDYV